ncbi:hypothetical protein BDW22DRAFT_318642 [Trametopsis cervina]|nr:hypothetical protein BDW22DRAFT_318642 [Trametopsis cervina]
MDIVRSRMFMSVPEGSCERTTVPQEAYRTQDPYTQLPKIQFCAREMPGIRLADALDLDSLISILDGASDKMALSGMSPTIFLRILWPGYDMWHASIRIVQPDHGLKPITRAKLALEVAKKVEACLHNLSTVPSQDRWSDWCATKYSIDQVMLLELNHVAAGSWQPMLATRRTRSRTPAKRYIGLERLMVLIQRIGRSTCKVWIQQLRSWFRTRYSVFRV